MSKNWLIAILKACLLISKLGSQPLRSFSRDGISLGKERSWLLPEYLSEGLKYLTGNQWKLSGGDTKSLGEK
jgi:hypothetical protein